MASKRVRNARKPAKSRKPSSPRAQALAFVRGRILQYEADLALLRGLATQLEGTGGRASASSSIVKAARAAGYEP